MPFCPNCKYEYKSAVERCPDCGAELVDQLKDKSGRGLDDDVKAVLLLKTDNYLKAQLVAGALEQEGIPFWAKRLGIGDRLGGSVTGAITHVVYDPPKPAEIYVNPADLPGAREILRIFDEDSKDEED